MSVNKTKSSKKSNQLSEELDRRAAEYLHLQFPWKTAQEIREAIKLAGPSRSKILKHLSK